MDNQSAGPVPLKLVLKWKIWNSLSAFVPQNWPANEVKTSLFHARISVIGGCGFLKIKKGLPQPVVNPSLDLEVNEASRSPTLGLDLGPLDRSLSPLFTILYAEPESVKSPAEFSLPDVLNRVKIRRARSRGSMNEVEPVIIAIIKSILGGRFWYYDFMPRIAT